MRFSMTKKRFLLVLLFGAIVFCLWLGWLYYERSKTSQRISSPIPPQKENKTSLASKRMKETQAKGKVTSVNHPSDKKLELLWEILKEDEQEKESKELIKVEEPINSGSDEESPSPQELEDEEWSTIDEWVDAVYEGMEIGTYLGFEVEIGGKKYPARLGVPIEVTWYGPGTDNPRKRTEEEQRRYDELSRELDNVDPNSPRGKEIIAEIERINAETIRPPRHESRALYAKPTKEELRDMYIKATPEERRSGYRTWAKKGILQNR